jgi:hypothetical protein
MTRVRTWPNHTALEPRLGSLSEQHVDQPGALGFERVKVVFEEAPKT